MHKGTNEQVNAWMNECMAEKQVSMKLLLLSLFECSGCPILKQPFLKKQAWPGMHLANVDTCFAYDCAYDCGCMSLSHACYVPNIFNLL